METGDRWVCVPKTMKARDKGVRYTTPEGPEAVTQRNGYLAAVLRGYAQDYEPLAAFFAAAIAPRLERPA